MFPEQEVFLELYFLEVCVVLTWCGCVVCYAGDGQEGGGSCQDGQQQHNNAAFLVRGHGGVVVNGEYELGGVLHDGEQFLYFQGGVIQATSMGSWMAPVCGHVQGLSSKFYRQGGSRNS